MPQHPNGYYRAENCDLDEFVELTSQVLKQDQAPNADQIEKNVPIYDMNRLRDKLRTPHDRQELMAEWAHILGKSAGVLVLRAAYADTAPIDAATKVYEEIIAAEKAANGTAADHFAAAGNNDRVWNSLQKLAEQAPSIFVDYFANGAIDAVCEAWLGPNYQMTAQVNLVYPGGEAQRPHRDYHLGFQTAEISATYPSHVHDLSPLMTLQGGIAHCDMPIESGPTKLLPFSQAYGPGYAAWRRDDFREYFEENYVQLALNKGDAVFFSPALFHGAGTNKSADIHRFVNLLQISSPFGRAMETVNREKMCRLVFPALCKKLAAGEISEIELDAVIASSAEGYSFPTNLDLDPPVGGLAPLTQSALLKQAVTEEWPAAEFEKALTRQSERRLAV